MTIRNISTFTSPFQANPALLSQLSGHASCAPPFDGEERVNLLERKVRRLRITEIDEWHKGQVRAHEYQEGLPLQIGKYNRGYGHDHEVPEPVARYADSCAPASSV